MAEGQYRVVVWSTGGIGSIAIRAIHERPNLDLVGVWVHSPEKDGMDAGELANGEPIGLAVTTDADALTQKLAAADIAFARVNDTAALAAHPQLRRIEVATAVGAVSYPAPAARRDGAPRRYGAVPALGEHSNAIRAEFMAQAQRQSE